VSGRGLGGQPFVERVVEILRDGVRRGEVRADLDAERLGLVFTGLSELAVTLHWGSGWPELDGIPDLVTSIFLDGAGVGSREVGDR
jgi:hypothetical protein